MLLDVADLDTAFNYDVVSSQWKHNDLHTTMGILEFGLELVEIRNFLLITRKEEDDTFVQDFKDCTVGFKCKLQFHVRYFVVCIVEV